MQNTTQANMTPVQAAAHRLLGGVNEVEGGKVDLTLALVPHLYTELSYTYNGASLTFNVIEYLPETAPRKRATTGEKKGELVKDNAHQRARAGALGAHLLGLNDDQSDKIGSHVITCIRAAAGITSLSVAAAGDEPAPMAVSMSKAGNFVVPVSAAFKMFDDTGAATAVGKVAFEEAKRDLVAEAKAFAKFSGTDVVMPDEEAIWDAAADLPVECSGAKQRQGKEAVSPYGDLPTNTAMLAELAKIAVNEGRILPAATRQGQTPDGDNTPVGKALSLLCKVLTPDDKGVYPEAFTSAQIASFGRLGKLIATFQKAEAEAAKVEAAALLAAAKEA